MSLLELDYKLPASYEGVMQVPRRSLCWATAARNAATQAAQIFQRYVDSLDHKFPRIPRHRRFRLPPRWNTSAESAAERVVLQEEISEIYRVSKSRLRNALVKLEPFATRPELTKP